MTEALERSIEGMITVQERKACARKIRTISSWLKKRHAWLGIEVLNRAKLYITSDIDRAAVSVTGSKVFLLFNYDFVSDIKLIELAGVIVHEALHVLLKHQKRINSFTNNFDRRLFTYACEAVVNDIIKHYYYLPLPGDCITGHGLLGKDCHKYSADQVFQMLKDNTAKIDPKELEKDKMDDHEVWGNKTTIFGQPCEDIYDSEEHNQTDSEDELVGDVLSSKNAKRDSYGRSPAGRSLSIQKVEKTKVSLIPFVSKIIKASKKYTTSWVKPNKKMMAIYPKVVLPSYPSDNKLKVLFCLDSSGSITEEMRNEFFAVASKPIPNAEFKMISFDTKWYEIDPQKKEVVGGGGTDPRCILDYIETQYDKKKPDLVFVLTDGYFADFNVDDPSQFVFLIKNGTTKHIPVKSKRLIL